MAARDQREQLDAPGDAATRRGQDVAPCSSPDDNVASEFICPGCGRPLAVALQSTMCFAEAQIYCPDCERDYQQRRGQWAETGLAVPPTGDEAGPAPR